MTTNTIILIFNPKQERAVLQQLEKEGCLWVDGSKPTEAEDIFDYAPRAGNRALIINHRGVITYSNNFYAAKFPEFDSYTIINAASYLQDKPPITQDITGTEIDEILCKLQKFNVLLKEANQLKEEVYDILDAHEIDIDDFNDVDIESRADNFQDFYDTFAYNLDAIQEFLEEKMTGLERED